MKLYLQPNQSPIHKDFQTDPFWAQKRSLQKGRERQIGGFLWSLMQEIRHKRKKIKCRFPLSLGLHAAFTNESECLYICRPMSV